MGNTSSTSLSHYESSGVSLKETGVISFDTLRLLYQQKKEQRHVLNDEVRVALHTLAVANQQYLSAMIEEATNTIEKLPAIDMKTFMSLLSEVLDRMEMELQDKVLAVYKVIQQETNAEAIKQKGITVGTRLTFDGPLDTLVTRKSLDRIRLHLAWLRELANIVINCTSTSRAGGMLTTYEIQFANFKDSNDLLMDRALQSLTPLPMVTAIVEWVEATKGML